jgi:hypothetical protein
LINTCLNQQDKVKKLNIKESIKRKNNQSISPETKKPKAKKSKLVFNGAITKQSSNLTDLNFFIKTIEKDLVRNGMNSSFPTTPNQIIKKVEDQIKSLGAEKLFQTKYQVKPLVFNSLHKNEDTTALNTLSQPGGIKQSSPQRFARNSNEEFSKTQRLSKKAPLLPASMADKIQTHRCGESDSRERDSSGRGGVSNNSASYTHFKQPAILTDRSLHQNLLQGLKDVKQSSSTRYDTTQPLLFKKGQSKSQTKAYGTLASKSTMLSPQLKRDQQSGDLVKGKMTNISLKKGKVQLTGKDSSTRPAQMTRNQE